MPGVFAVRRFIEKPSAARARRFASSDSYLWNCGIFIWRTEVVLGELRRFSPNLVRTAERWTKRAAGTSWTVPAAVMRRLPASPVDRAVLEKSSIAAVVRAAFRWSDVGNWDAYAGILSTDRRRVAATGRMVAIRSAGCVGVNQGGLSVFVGLDDVVAVRAGNTVLVCHRRSAQHVREAVKRVRELERLDGTRGIRP